VAGRRAQPRAYLLLPASTEALSGNRHVTLLDVSRTGAGKVESPRKSPRTRTWTAADR